MDVLPRYCIYCSTVSLSLPRLISFVGSGRKADRCGCKCEGVAVALEGILASSPSWFGSGFCFRLGGLLSGPA